MRKRKILLAVIAIVAICLAGEGIFACTQIIQANKTTESYKQKFIQILQQMEKIEDEEFDNLELPYSAVGGVSLYYENIGNKELKKISEELERLTGKLSADLCAQAFLNYEFKEKAQYFLASFVMKNCYEEESQNKTAFAKEGDAFLKMLASDKTSDSAKEIILYHMDPSEKNTDQWNEYKIDLLSESKTLTEFIYRLTNLFDYPHTVVVDDSEETIVEADKAQKEFLYKQCKAWIENPQHISNVVYIGAIETLILQQENLSEDEIEELYSLARAKLLELYQEKKSEDALLATNIISWLYEQGGWENYTFLQSMTEQFKSDSSLYSIILLNSLRETLEVQSIEPFMTLLKKDASPQRINTVVQLLNLLCQPKQYLSIRLDESVYYYINRLIEQLPSDQQPLLLENNITASVNETSLTRTADLDLDGAADQETYTLDAPSLYEVSFACGDQLSYQFPDNISAQIYLAQMRDLNHDGKNEFLLFGYQWEDYYSSQDNQLVEGDQKPVSQDETDSHYFCLVMEKKEDSNIYTVVPTKSGKDCYYFQFDEENNQDDYSDKWINELNFSQ